VVNYAPMARISLGASHVWADWIFGGILLLAVTWMFLLAWNAWVHAIALRKEVWQARGLRPGVIMLAGVAEAVEHERHEGTELPPFVELTIRQLGEQRHTKNGHYILWKETSRSLSERPFHLRTDAGTLVRVEPSGRIDLIDRLEPPQRTGVERLRLARILPGERIWVRGQLTALGTGGGPYRGDGATGGALHTLRPARDRPLFISSEPVEREERSAARFHALFGLTVLAAMLFTQLVIFGSFQALRARGVDGTARVDNQVSWVTHNKNSSTTHWGFDLGYVVDGIEYTTREEVSRDAYDLRRLFPEDRTVPIVYDPRSPGTMQIGGKREVGLTDGRVIGAMFLVVGLLMAWGITSHSRRPWWRRAKLNETQPGTL
jgi:hypothetical protein